MPLEQHPVPQHISSYEFRLVGDMTLKQFAYLAGGTMVALFFYSLPLLPFIKWPLVITAAFFGFAFAFMPIEERPLSIWFLAFLKSAISPTLFIWERKAKKPEIFAPTAEIKKPFAKVSLPPADKQQLSSYLQTLPPKEPKSKLDQQEENLLMQVSSLFQQTQQIKVPVEVKPQWEIPKFKPPPEKPRPRKTMLRGPFAQPLIIPDKYDKLKGTVVEAKTGAHLPIPAPPTFPNIIAGMVLDKNGELIEGAILEIRNSDGMPVRAFKTNKLGQFVIATPLENGVYEIETEKENHRFDIIKIEAKGEIIKPIEIRAK